jgi:hypothetical protein
VTALRVQEFDKGPRTRRLCADRAGFVTCPYSPIRVLARVPLSNSGAAGQLDADARTSYGCGDLGWLNLGWLSLLPVDGGRVLRAAARRVRLAGGSCPAAGAGSSWWRVRFSGPGGGPFCAG